MNQPPRPLPANAVWTPPIKQPVMPPEGLPGEPVDAPATVAPAKSREKLAVLRFLNPEAMQRTIALKYPFAYDVDGVEIEVRTVTVRRLAVAEVGAIIIGKTADTVDLFEFYAAISGLPAEVLRATPEDEEVIEACRPFLPAPVRDLLEALGLPIGAATPSPAPDPAASPSARS